MKSLLRWTAASLAAVFLVSAPQKSYSQVFSGNSSVNWSDGLNWVGGVAPAGATAITFADSPTFTTNTNDIVGLTVTGINFTNNIGNPETTASNTTFTLNGNKIILGGNVITSAAAHDGVPTNNRNITDTINLDIDLNGTRTFTINSAGTNNNTQSQHDLVINGNIGETAPGVGRLQKAGGRILTLNGVNTFTNGIQITGGTINFNSAAALSTGILRSSNGTFNYSGTGNTTVSNAIDMYNTNNQGVTLSNNGGTVNDVLTFNGTFTSSAGTQVKRLQLNGSNTGDNTFATDINDYTVQTRLEKSGNGRWLVGDNNSYTGTTQLNAGTLQVANLQDDLSLASSIGRGADINFNGGGLHYEGTAPVVIANRTINLIGTNNQDGIFGNDSALATDTVTFNGTFINSAGTQAKELVLRGSNTGNNEFQAVISDSTDGAGSDQTELRKDQGGRWIVSGANTYTGVTRLNGGTLQVGSWQDDLALAAELGRNPTIFFSNGQLALNSAGNTTTVIANRTMDLNGTNNQDGTLRNDSADAGANLIFNGNFTNSAGTQAKQLILRGTNTGDNQYNAVVSDGGFSPIEINKLDTGRWSLSGANTNTGKVFVGRGTLSVASIGNKGGASNLGSGASLLANEATIRLGGGNDDGTLEYTGAGETSDKLFQIGNGVGGANDGGGRINNVGTGALVLTGEGGFFNSNELEANSTNRRQLALGGNFSGTNEISGIIQDNALAVNATGTAAVQVLKDGTATTWKLSGANTYSGATLINQGTLSAATIGNKGGASNLGSGGDIAAGDATIRLGSGGSTGTLLYTGAGETSDKLFQIGNGGAVAATGEVTGGSQGGGSIINNSGTGALVLNGEGGFFNSISVLANSTAARALTLTGGVAGGLNQINAIIRDNSLAINATGVAEVRVVKNGAGTWALNGANTYTGNTTVNAGTLLINGSTAGGDVIVNNNGNLGGTGTVGGAATISGELSPGNSPGVLTFGAGVSLAANSTFTWELAGNTESGRGTNFDGVDVTGGSLSIDPTANSNLVFNASGSTVDFNNGFWTSDRSWLVFDNANAYAGATFGTIGLSNDSLANAPGILPGTFAWGISGGDVYLNYTTAAIPEPSSLLLTVLGIAGFGLRRSRKNRS